MTDLAAFADLTAWARLGLWIGGAACMLGVIAIWRRKVADRLSIVTMAMLGAAGVHLLMASASVDTPLLWLAEALRNGLCLMLIYQLFSIDGRDSSLSPVRPVIVALAAVAAMQVLLVIMSEGFAASAALARIAASAAAFRMVFAVGMLVLVHNLYTGADPRHRPWIARFAAGMVLAWGYELNYATVEYVLGLEPTALVVLRGLAWGWVAFLLWQASGMFGKVRRHAPSRNAAFQSLSLFLIALYLLGMLVIDRAAADMGLRAGALGNFVLVLTAVATGALLASSSLRARAREALSRHLFGQRYDYRDEWLGFARRIGGTESETAESLEKRAIQALAAITDSPSGLLLMPDGEGSFALSARWNWSTVEVPAAALEAAAAQAIARDGRIIAIDDARRSASSLPDWMLEEGRAWALVPLMLASRLEAVAILARPAFSRPIDREDRDLLGVAGQQLAVHLSEQVVQRRLLENSRFDEFNRRMAFVMHDIKNLSSQLSLLVGNAERHIEKPEFRADMLVTMGNAAQRLEKLVGRLSGYGTVDGEVVEAIAPADVARAVLPAFPGQQVIIGHGGDTVVRAGPAAVEQVLRHLIQNALDASEANGAVHLDFPVGEFHAGISIADGGTGMPAEFVRNQLFAPFVSTKSGGFGIGAYEAREMVRAMGGRIDVESREGLGSRFVVWLPRADLHRLYDAMESAAQREVA